MNNMNIGGTELGSEDEIADSDDDGRFKLFYSNQFNSIVFRKTITATGDFFEISRNFRNIRLRSVEFHTALFSRMAT